MNLLRLSKVNESDFPLRACTLYKWVHTKKHPELFIKIGGAVFVDQDKFFEMAAAGKLAASSR